MAGTLELEGRIQYAKRGSPKFDAEIGRIVRPDAEVFFDGGEPYWGPPDAPNRERVPRYSRSITSTLPWEDIVSIDLFRNQPRFWRAVQRSDVEAIALTEALARRLAAIRAIRQREPAQPIKSTGDPGPPLSLFVLRCIEDLSLSADMAYRVRMIVRYFIEVNGDIPIARYGRSHVWNFRRVLRRKPVGYARRAAHVDRMVLACFVLGLSTRKVAVALAPILGRRISAGTVSQVAKTLDGAVAAFHRRPLKDIYRIC